MSYPPVSGCDGLTRPSSARVRKKVLIVGNQLGLASVCRLRTVPVSTPYIGASKGRVARQLAVLIVLLGCLVASSSEAEALLCEAETEESQLMSTVAVATALQSTRFFSLAIISDAVPVQVCDAQASSDCDIKLPGGQPQPPETTRSLRPSAALTHGQLDFRPTPPAHGLYALAAGELLPGHYGTLYRPPRS